MGLKKNIIAFSVIGIVGTLSHFVYEWSGENAFLGLIFPVNESVWEHLKLIFFPALIYFVIEYILLSEKPHNYISAAITGVFCSMLSVVVLYYTASGILGRNIDFINIVIYFIALIITISKRNKIIKSNADFSKLSVILLLSLTATTALLFFICSFVTPKLGIFVPPA